MKGLRLYKKEKLCSTTAIDALFSHSAASGPAVEVKSSLSYPLRCVWRVNKRRGARLSCPQFVIVVPKKRLRKAVERVLMRRRIREAYRLNRSLFPSDCPVDICFVYVSQKVKDYHSVERSMQRLLNSVADTLATAEILPENNTPQDAADSL